MQPVGCLTAGARIAMYSTAMDKIILGRETFAVSFNEKLYFLLQDQEGREPKEEKELKQEI